MDFKLHLAVENIENLPVGSHDCNMIAKVEWRGSERKAGFSARGFEKNYTCQRKVQENGTVSWNEGFDHTCKLKGERSERYRSWIISLQIEEVQEKARYKRKNIGKAKVNVAEFVKFENEKSIRIPINCRVRGHIAEAMLMVKLQLIKVESKDKNQATLTRACSLYSFMRKPVLNSRSKTCRFKVSHNQSVNLPVAYPSSHDNEPDLQYSKQPEANLLILNETSNGIDIKKLTETYIQDPSTKAMKQKQRPLARFLSRNTSKLGLNRLSRRKSPPPLNKEFAGSWDDIGNDRHHLSCIQFLTPFKQVKVRPEENIKQLGIEDNHKFEAGHWERKKIVSRDDKIELVTDVFHASIDQCSERAAGGSACTVLAAVIADWLHNNPMSLPLQCQFDELVLKGSLEWRNLCANENHKVKFSDKHFDLDTVLEAKVRPLTVVLEKSHVGFLSIDEMPEVFDWLQGEMSFDNIWNDILRTDVSEVRIYIASWNDHFFVLKVENDVVYLLDTLGERLSEGCKQAYILKFDAESAVYKHSKDGKENNSSQDLVSEGIDCCKEYIKGFLSAIPLRELQQDIKRGRAKEELLHRLLQIDFHYTAPCTTKTY